MPFFRLQACEDYYCVDPCLSGTCKATDFCRVMNHRPICGFNYEAPPQVAGTRDTSHVAQLTIVRRRRVTPS